MILSKYFTMIEYARALYQVWSRDKTLPEQLSGHEEYLKITADLLSYTVEEIRVRIESEPWVAKNLLP